MASRPDLPHTLVGQLIRPLRVGANVTGAWRLRRAGVSEDGKRIEYTLSPPDLMVVVEPRDDGAAALARSASFNVYYKSEDDVPMEASARAALQAIVELVMRNDLEGVTNPRPDSAPAPSPDTGEAATHEKCTLYLVPGHLSNDRDLGPRTVHALASSQNVFVEQDKEADTGTLLEQLGVDLTRKQIVSIPHDPTQVSRPLAKFREAVERGEDSCLFGLNDGIPAFCDPGREIVLEAARFADRVRIQSIGGPSALGAVLMRAESEIEGFLFAGVLQYETDLAAFEPMLGAAAGAGLPIVFYGMGARLKRLLPALLARVPERRGRLSLYCDLTSEREAVSHAELPGEDATSALADDSRVVVVIAPETASQR
jgi:16S rRNA C1402 (ribose-2'-O) methylase RsmI